MTGMLASVTSVTEANIALNEKVDIIDLKNPREGALGALDVDILREVVKSINGAITTSATVGDVNPNDPGLLKTINYIAATGVDIVKVGLFDNQASDYFINIISQAVEQGIRLVIVLFAEDYLDPKKYEALMQTGISGIMLDTKNKEGQNLTGILDTNILSDFINIARHNRLMTGLAGSLKYKDIEVLLKINPDYLGFRGALCSGNKRINQLDQFKIKKIRNAIPQTENINYYFKNSIEEALKNGAMA